MRVSEETEGGAPGSERQDSVEEWQSIEAQDGPGSQQLTVQIPPDAPDDVKRGITSYFGMLSRFGPMPSPLEEKLTNEHVTSIIESTREDTKRGYQERREGRIVMVSLVIGGVIFFGWLVVNLGQSNPDLLLEVVKGVVLFGGGLAGGYGLRSTRT